MPDLCQTIRSKHASDSEIHHLNRSGIGQHHIRRLDVAMDDSHLVRVIDSFERHAKQLDGPLALHRSVSSNDLIQRLTAYKLHDHEKVFALPEEAMECRHIGMVELCQRDRF